LIKISNSRTYLCTKEGLMNWLEKKSELEKLKRQYSDLMRQSYETALKDKQESDRINREAQKVYDKIMLFQAKESVLDTPKKFESIS